MIVFPRKITVQKDRKKKKESAAMDGEGIAFTRRRELCLTGFGRRSRSSEGRPKIPRTGLGGWFPPRRNS